jgi:hypothetical protein
VPWLGLGLAVPGLTPTGGPPPAKPPPLPGSGRAEAVTAEATCHGNRATIVGTSGPDRIVATAGPDVIVTGGGGDTVVGVDAGDLLCRAPAPDQPHPSAASPASSLSANAKAFGYTEPGIPLSADSSSRMANAAAGGSTFVRMIVAGCPGLFDWGAVDAAFTRAGQLGLRVLLVPMWRRSCGLADNDFSPPYADQAPEWQRFVRDAIDHVLWYTHTPPWVEIWNEPNTRGFWCSDGRPLCDPTPSPGWYAYDYYHAWQGAQDAEADWAHIWDVPVMTGGLGKAAAPCPGDRSYVCPETFLNGVRSSLGAAGAVGRVESTAAHIYPEQDNWDVVSRSEGMNRVGGQFNEIRRPFPSVYTPTFITEAGVRSNDTGPGQAHLTESYQCDRLLDLYNGWMPSTVTAGWTVFRLYDGDALERLSPFRFMGTMSAGGSDQKQAFDGLRRVSRGDPVTDC